MSGRNLLLTILLVAGSVAGGFYLLNVEFRGGSTYPKYSSLRSDSLGAKLLYDTLALMPGTTVARNYLPLEYLARSGATVFMLNVIGESLTAEQLRSVDALASRGNRVVMAMSAVIVQPENKGPLTKIWKVRLGLDILKEDQRRLFFSESAGWKTVRQDGLKPLVIERGTGKGSVMLFADSRIFANVNIVDTEERDFPLISTAIGQNSRVVFDEEHFGISQTGSVVGLVRRFHLSGMAFGFAICAALFIWRSATAFPPPDQTQRAANISGRASHSGLLTLLRRHVPVSELISVCWNEWLAANRRSFTPERLARAQEIVSQSGAEPVKAMREIQSVLHSKGTP